MPTPGIRQSLEFGVAGQSLVLESDQGRPSSDGSVTIYDPRYAPDDSHNPIASGTATRGSASTTLTAAAGPNEDDPTLVTLTSIANISVGDLGWLVNDAGQSEQVEVAAVDSSAKTITTAWPLTLTYASGATYGSGKMTSPALSTSWLSDKNNLGADYYAIWTYTVGGITYRKRTGFDLTRAAVQISAVSRRAIERYPGLKKFAFPDHPQGFDQIARAAVRDVTNLLRLRGIDVAKLRGGYELQDWLFEIRLGLLMARNGVVPNGRDRENVVNELTRDWDDASAQFSEGTIPVPYDGNDDDVIHDGERSAGVIPLGR